MEKTNFWNDAAFYGVIMALVAIVFDTVNFYTQHALVSLVSLLIYLTLLTLFTKQRVARYGVNGYSYGQCLRFIVAVVLCAGFIDGAYMSAAANWLFASRYDTLMSQQIATLEGTGFYNDEQLVMLQRMLYSPLALILSAVIGSVIKGGFFGLFISAYARREQPLFTPGAPSDDASSDSDGAAANHSETPSDNSKNA